MGTAKRTPLGEAGPAADRAVQADHCGEPRRHIEPASRPDDQGARRADGSRVREREAAGVLEEANCRRLEHGRAEKHVREWILRMLACRRAAGEERLERLSRELNDLVAVDSARPAALEIGFHWTEHAEP